MVINIQYLIPLLLSWIFTGWLYKLDHESQKYILGRAYVMDTTFYKVFKIILAIAIIISLILNVFLVDWMSSLCYFVVLLVVQLINVNIIYYIHEYLFGTDYFGVAIPLVIAPLSVIYLFIAQFVLPVIPYTIK